MLESLKGFFF